MIFAFQSFELDDELYELRDSGLPVAIERRVFDLILHLVRHRERLVTKAELLDAIWEGRAVSRASVSVAMTAARKVLRDRATAPTLIATHSRRGYRFIGAVVEKSLRPPVGPFAAHRNRSRVEDLLVGRAEPCAKLEALLESTARGEFAVVLVSGEAGIGKTRLLDEAARMGARRGFVVELGSCPDEPGSPPLWPWTQVLRGTALGAPVAELESNDPRVRELSELLPPADGTARVEAAPSLEASEQSKFRLSLCVGTVLEALAVPTPLLILLDDLHRADQASLDLLASIGSTAKPRGVMVAASYRQTVSSSRPAFQRALGLLMRSPCTHRIELVGLSHDAARSLIAATSPNPPSESFVTQMTHRSAGNPFFLRQLVAQSHREPRGKSRGDSATLSDDLLAAITYSLRELPRETKELLSVASVAGTEFPIDLLAALADIATPVALNDLQPAMDSRFVALSSAEGSLQFSHALVREALYQQLPAVRRAFLHKRCAEFLAGGATSSRPQRLAALAHHYYQSIALGTARDAARFALEAAEWAASHASYEEAAALYSRALELIAHTGDDSEGRRCQLLLLIGTQHLCAGARKEAVAAFESAARIAQTSGAADALATTALALAPGVLAIETGVVDRDLIKLLKTALASNSGSDPIREAKLRARLSIALHWTDDRDLIASLVHDSLSLADRSANSEAILHAKQAQWFSCHGPSAPFSRLDLARELVGRSSECGDASLELVCRLFVLGALLERGASATFEAELSQYAALAERLRQPQSLWYVPMLRGARALMQGRLDDAARWRDEFVAMGARAGDANAHHSAMAHTLLLLHETDRACDAHPVVSQAVDRFPAVPGWRATRAWVLAHSGAAAASRRDIDFVIDQGYIGGAERLDWMATAALISEAIVLVGDSERAGLLYDKLLPLCDRFFVVGLCVVSWGAVARNLGLLAEVIGDWHAARAHLEQAVRLNRGADAVAWEAQSAIDLARLLLRSPVDRDVTRARDLLETATATATQLRLTRIARVSSELLRSL